MLNSIRSNPSNSPMMSRGNSIFSLKDVGLSIGDSSILDSINLDINRGEIVFITGVSGAGKTSLLRILSGEIMATSGVVIRDSKIFSGLIFQDLRLLSKKSCREHLFSSYDKAIYRSKGEFLSDLDELASYFAIKGRLDLPIAAANGGLKQKVAIIRALLARPDVLLADEPTSSLDFENAKRLFNLLNIYNVKRGLTVIWASHNRDLVKKFSGRIIHLDNGRLLYSGHACFI